jgi:hypothetical protein
MRANSFYTKDLYKLAELPDEAKGESTTTASAPSDKKVKKTEAELPYAVRYLRASANPDKESTENTDGSKPSADGS